jgi:hypothetical protein
VRLAVRTAELPDESGACEAISTLTYGRVHINDAGFLLPSETLFRIVTTTGVEDENRTVYTARREIRFVENWPPRFAIPGAQFWSRKVPL